MSQGNPFLYPAFDLTSMVALDALPYVACQFGQTLNAPGSWTGSLPIADPSVRSLAYLDSSRTGRTLLCVDLGGVLVWGGIIWTRRYQESAKRLQVGAMEIGSYFAQRLQALDYSTSFSAGADPMTIAKTVLTDATAVSTIAGGITVTLNPAGGSGQTVAASYPGTQLQTIESIVSNLSQMGYTLGFDYSFDVAYLPGTKTPGVTMNIWYPRQGRTAAASQIVITNKDSLDFTYDEDSTKQANEITETGSGTGGLQPVKVSASTSGYPLLQTAISHADVNDLGILSNMAFGDLEQLCWPVTTPTITLPVPTPDPVTGVVAPEHLGLGQFGLGDDLIWRIDPVAGGGENTSPRFPNGMNFEWRITNWTVVVPEAGVPTLVFDLSIPPINTVPPTAPPL